MNSIHLEHSLDSSPEQRDKRGSFVTTYSGSKFFIDQCNIEDIKMEDIAHALSMNCRFNGHLKKFYSVAEHSILVSRLVPKKYALEGLLHDITEAFLPDMPRPFKSMINGFAEYENKLHQKIAECYNLLYPLPDEVKYIDKNIVRDEAEVLYKEVPDWVEFYDNVCPHWKIYGFTPYNAKRYFLARYEDLMYA